jgi:hypothetical protein
MNDLVKTELGLDVPEKPEQAWRKHTAERWKRDDRESYEMCVFMIRQGELNQSELARLVAEHRGERGIEEGISRNTIHALMMSEEFSAGELDAIAAKGASVLRAQTLGKASEMVDKVRSAKDLGALAMVATTGHNIAQTMCGKPTSIQEKQHKFNVQDFDAIKAKAKAKAAVVIDVMPEALPMLNDEIGLMNDERAVPAPLSDA